MTAKIAAIVLAAGKSDRFGAGNKLLAMLAGRPVIALVMDQVGRSRAGPVVVVTGAESNRLKAEVQTLSIDVKFVENPNYDKGLSTSLQAGIAAFDKSVEGALVVLGDMPLITAEIIDALIEDFASSEGVSIVIPVHARQQGNPVLWAREHFPELMTLSGDAGAKELLKRHDARTKRLELGPAVLRDVDHKAALAALRLELE